nr:MAG TPA: hypothetical protein [Caudoviricetes sp.]
MRYDYCPPPYAIGSLRRSAHSVEPIQGSPH